jgi:hypothetical protein
MEIDPENVASGGPN